LVSAVRRPKKLVVLIVVAAALLVWLLLGFRGHGARSTAAAPVSAIPAFARTARPAAEPARVPTPSKQLPVAAPAPDPGPGTVGRFVVPKEGTRASHRSWVKAGWGKADGQIGLDYLGGGTDLYTPQGFVPTRDGRLIVLDSNNVRLVQYDERGRIERTISVAPLVAPADVALARDGTLIVTDHGGVQTRGILLIRPDGSTRELQGIQPSEMVGMYAVGNDFWFEVGEGSVHGGNTQGELSDETPGVYNDEDSEIVPGLVAPDGKTVITIGVDEEALPRGEFFVSAIRGEPPEHLFTHYFTWPRRLEAIRYADADDQGRIYAVVLDGPSGHDALVCLDPEGHAVGTVDMGKTDQEPGRTLRNFAVVPSGGLVVMHPSDDGVRYDWYDCH
jgi:hypothetical protein